MDTESGSERGSPGSGPGPTGATVDVALQTPLSEYQVAEFEQRIAAARGQLNARWWAEYSLKLSARELWGDAAQAAHETAASEWNVEPVVAALRADELPSVNGALEPLAALVRECIGARVTRYWTTYKRLSTEKAQALFGDYPLDGWYTRLGDGDFLAVDRPRRANEIDLLVQAAAAVRA